MRFFLCLVFTFLALDIRAQASVYSGVLVNNSKNELRLKDEGSGKSFELTFATPEVAKIYKRLKVNDYISLDGARSPSVASIRIDSVNFVGLGQVLGVWRGDDHYCYSFLSYTEFAVHPSRSAKCARTTPNARHYAYTINPSEDLSWVMLLSDGRANYAADLIIKSEKSLEIRLYDSNTGYILKVIKLRK